MAWTFEPVGVVRSPFREKFGIPRQPGLVPEARATIELLPPFDAAETVRGLDGFSHVWVVFVFHATATAGWAPTVRPPRLGGNRRVGVFASRATHRPNPLGLSALRLESIETEGGVRLHVAGPDLLDGTPVLDIKPYVPYTDSHPDAVAGFAAGPPPASLEVVFTEAAAAACDRAEAAGATGLRSMIVGMLAADPRPAYRGDEPGRVFGVRVFDVDVRFTVADGVATVCELNPVAD